MDLNKTFEDDTMRALNALGGQGTIVRDVADHVTITIPVDQWIKMFNMAEGFAPCDPNWTPFSKAIVCRFTRVVKEEKKGV